MFRFPLRRFRKYVSIPNLWIFGDWISYFIVNNLINFYLTTNKDEVKEKLLTSLWVTIECIKNLFKKVLYWIKKFNKWTEKLKF